jgi:hypothetical protein
MPRWNADSWLASAAFAGAVALLHASLMPVAWAQAALEVIPLRYRAAQEVIPVIQPMLAPGGSVSGYQGQLVVRTTPANLEEIKRILGSIDTAPRQLMITVMQEADAGARESSAEISGTVGGERGRVTIPDSRGRRGGSVVLHEGDDRVRARVLESSTSASDRNTQSVRVLEGREAYVQVGQSVPLRERQVRRTIVGGQVVEQVIGGTQYRDVTTGFYVLPRLSGDRVTLDISPQRETLSGQVRGGVNVQSVVTTVSGRLGEWMEIGAVGQDAAGQQAVLLGRSATASRDSRRVLVRVEEVR